TTALTERSTGRDLLPLLREKLPQADQSKWGFCAWLFDRFDCFPTTGDNHVGEYIGYAAEFIGTKGYNFRGYAQSRKLGHANVDAWAAGTKPVSSLLRQRSREARLGHSVTEIMAALATGATV